MLMAYQYLGKYYLSIENFEGSMAGEFRLAPEIDPDKAAAR